MATRSTVSRVSRSSVPSTPQAHAARIAAQDARMPEALRAVVSRPAAKDMTSARAAKALPAWRMDNSPISIFK